MCKRICIFPCHISTHGFNIPQLYPLSPLATASSKSFEILVRQHHRRLLAYALSILGDEHAARDVVQDAFVTAYQTLDKFDASKDFGAWVRGILRNKCHEWRRTRNFVAVDEELLEVIDHQHREWDELEAETGGKVMAALQTCLPKLSNPLSQVVNLFYMNRLSGKDVASEIGEEEATVRKRLQRARKQLGECITRTLQTQD